MFNKKNTKILIISSIVIAFLICVVFLSINYSKDDTSFSIIERKWITSNVNDIKNVNIYNDIPVYGYNGNGISFSFLDKFTEEYGIKFNKISYFSTNSPEYGDIAFRVLDNNTKVANNDILFYIDNYVIVSKDDLVLDDLFDISDNIGILSNDKEVIDSYLNDNLKVTNYKSIDLLMENINNDSIKYAILPNMMYMNKILANKLNIVYHVSDLNKKYVLSVKDKTIYNIMKKYYLKYLNSDLGNDYSKAYLDVYFNSTNSLAVEQKNYNANVYRYGFAVNMPYENFVDGKFVGTISNYLKEFENVTNVEIETIMYNSIDEVKKALVSGDVDFALTNFDYENLNMKSLKTMSFDKEEYVVLSKNNININSVKGLAGYDVNVIASSNLFKLCNDNGINTKIFANTDELIRNVDDDDIVILDKDTYVYYKDVKLDKYKIVYEGKSRDGYRFIINDKYKTFADMFGYYISSNDYNNIRFMYNTNVNLEKDNSNILFIVLIIAVIIGCIYIGIYISKKKAVTNNVSKDDRIKFIDPMTSLKNRNYLNHNIYSWDDNVIFPQSVVVFDVNKLKIINDKLGREAGDEIIKKVASILINNQLENTDIIRSGGDEFLVYMVGYDEKQTIEYAKKNLKLMNCIGNSEGVCFGYSMIFDEVKTVDDAINESIAMLTKEKDKDI